MTVYKREGTDPAESWNELIRRVNVLAAECDLTPLDLVDFLHRWSKDDITEAQDKLLEICSESTFSPPPDLWSQSAIEELIAAIERGACCGECTDGTFGGNSLNTTGHVTQVGSIVSCTVTDNIGFGDFQRDVSNLESYVEINYQSMILARPEGLHANVGGNGVWSLRFHMCRTATDINVLTDNDCGINFDLSESIEVASGEIEQNMISFAGAPSQPLRIEFPRATDVAFTLSTIGTGF